LSVLVAIQRRSTTRVSASEREVYEAVVVIVDSVIANSGAFLAVVVGAGASRIARTVEREIGESVAVVIDAVVARRTCTGRGALTCIGRTRAARIGVVDKAVAVVVEAVVTRWSAAFARVGCRVTAWIARAYDLEVDETVAVIIQAVVTC